MRDDFLGHVLAADVARLQPLSRAIGPAEGQLWLTRVPAVLVLGQALVGQKVEQLAELDGIVVAVDAPQDFLVLATERDAALVGLVLVDESEQRAYVEVFVFDFDVEHDGRLAAAGEQLLEGHEQIVLRYVLGIAQLVAAVVTRVVVAPGGFLGLGVAHLFYFG